MCMNTYSNTILIISNVETCDLVFDVENPPVCNKTDTYLQLPSYGCAQR